MGRIEHPFLVCSGLMFSLASFSIVIRTCAELGQHVVII